MENMFGILVALSVVMHAAMRNHPHQDHRCLHPPSQHKAHQDSEVDKEGNQQDDIAGTWRRQQAHMADMQQRLPPTEGNQHAWQQRNYLKEFVTMNRGEVPWQNRAIDALHY